MPPCNPNDYESQTAFMRACVPGQMDAGKGQDQAVAICLSMWREKSENRRRLVLADIDADSSDAEIDAVVDQLIGASDGKP